MLRSRLACAAARRIALEGLTSAPWSRLTRLPPTLEEVAWDSGCQELV